VQAGLFHWVAAQKYLYFLRYKKYNPLEKTISLVLAKNEVTKQSKRQGMVSLPAYVWATLSLP
jgi:hypothetical protein